jgi:hypothetical protein
MKSKVKQNLPGMAMILDCITLIYDDGFRNLKTNIYYNPIDYVDENECQKLENKMQHMISYS